MVRTLYFVAALLFCQTLYAEELAPFSWEWSQNPASPVNLSNRLDAPAGKDGFIRIEDGHFVRPNGKRLKIWGINVSANACFPEKEHAAEFADYIARFGINGVRFHFMDSPWTKFLEGDPDTSQTFNADLFDRFDYFIYQLKQQGIYINLNLNVARRFKEGDGVREAEYLGFAKGATYFDERLIELQKDYAQKLLTHINPYTKTEYRNEPAVNIVEIVNENSLVEYWAAGRLKGENTTKNPGTWTDIPPSYAKQLNEQFNQWFAKNVSTAEQEQIRIEAGVGDGEALPRLVPEQFKIASTLRFRTEARFYVETEKRFFQMMYAFLKNELGVKAHIVGSSDHNHYKSGYAHLSANALLEVVDSHVYWQHPNYKEGRVDGRGAFEIENTPMVNNPYFSTPVQLSRAAIEGKPFTVSETNHPYPNEYACEGIPILAAYAALQDWDGIYFYTFDHAPPSQWKPEMRGHFDIRPDAVKMANLAASAFLFMRGDIAPADKTVLRSYSAPYVLDSIRMPSSERPYFTPGFDLSVPLRYRTRVLSLSGEQSTYLESERPSLIFDDEKQLTWNIQNPNQGAVSINTEMTQGVVGYIRSSEQPLQNLSLNIENDFASVLCVSLDNRPIELSRSMMLAATAKAHNADTKWNKEHTSLQSWGRQPLLTESVRGTVVLKGLKNARQVKVYPIAPNGAPANGAISAQQTQDGWSFSIGETACVM
ncbi:MAG: cellulase family glycosylhydrolase [Candidatus Hinthialibacter antarcticus]|nr:cellulase family glycosylhydrolase [Candidatus Hinthialibacter antarcticus]